MYPEEWKDSLTVVVRKTAKADYMVPGAYHPILLRTMGTILSACIVKDIVQMAEMHGLLPDNHFLCQPGRLTSDLLHFTLCGEVCGRCLVKG